MTASGELICSVLWPLLETAMGLRCNCLVGALAIQTMRDTIITLVQSQYSLPRTKYRTRSPVVATAKIDNNEKTRMIRCLVHSVIGVLYRAAANRRQRNLHIIKGDVTG